MTVQSREVVEGRRFQGVDEIIVYTLDVSALGSSPTSTSAVVKDTTDGSTVTSTVMPSGSTSVASNVITLPALKLLTANRTYKVEVKYTLSGNTLESYFYVEASE
jgi:hypothetical protein